MQTITLTHLNALILRLNKAAGTPLEPYAPGISPAKPQPGNFHLDHAYGGVTLLQMAHGGGASNVFYCGYTTKRELAALIDAFLKGLDYQKTKREFDELFTKLPLILLHKIGEELGFTARALLRQPRKVIVAAIQEKVSPKCAIDLALRLEKEMVERTANYQRGPL